MSYFLLTGATGLLGGYLLRDLTLAGVPLAVLVRPTRWESAAQRIETILARWERELGHALARPVVLEGEISEANLGLSAADLEWVTQNVHAIVHSAAALTFVAESPEGEPWLSNVQGTRNVLELCRAANIRQCHYVSTAYVCGLRSGRILESELDVGQTPGNDYEHSKLIAEQEVLASGIFDSTTVYRPSIIVGDAVTGYTSSYHGFYTPLRLIHSIAQVVPWTMIAENDWLGRLQLEGGERKNFVPVDWISATMTWLITHPECHGTTYHLTNPQPATVALMREAMTEILVDMVQFDSNRPAPQMGDDIGATFREQMGVYKSYWRDDPQFDSARTQAAAPHLPCPVIDREIMHRLVRFAIAGNFGWPREASIVPQHDIGGTLAPWLAAEPRFQQIAASESAHTVNLDVSGPGGGQWRLRLDRGALVAAGRGLDSDAVGACYLTSDTLAGIAQRNLSWDDSLNTGRLVVAGSLIRPLELARVLRGLQIGAGK